MDHGGVRPGPAGLGAVPPAPRHLGDRKLSGSWEVRREAGPAAALHGREPEAARVVSICAITRPAVVLGSAQRDSAVDGDRAAARGFDVVRRRSGGGAVLLEPERLVWVDVTVPQGDPLWVDDVGRAFEWLGDVWAGVLGGLGVRGGEVHRGGLVRTRWSGVVCFAGLGPGEVRVDGHKVVGLSQRRTRRAALFQCACLLRWDPAPLVDVLVWPEGIDRPAVVTELADVAVGLHDLDISVTVADIESAFVAALPVL